MPRYGFMPQLPRASSESTFSLLAPLPSLEDTAHLVTSIRTRSSPVSKVSRSSETWHHPADHAADGDDLVAHFNAVPHLRAFFLRLFSGRIIMK